MKRLLFSFLALTACNTDFFEAEGIGNTTWKPTVAIPIGYAEYSLDELLTRADSLVEVREDENNFITLVYEKQLVSESARSFLGLVQQRFNKTYNLRIPPPYPDPVVSPGMQFRSRERLLFKYNSGENASMDSATFENGILDIEVQSSIKAEVQAQLLFPGILKNGEPLVINMNLNNYGGASIIKTNQTELNDFKIDLTNNPVETIVTLDITTYGAPVSSSDYITVKANLHDFTFKSFFGNVGTRSINIKEERFTFDVFNEVGIGEVYFSDPRLVFTISNSFGIPIAVDFAGINAEDPEEGLIYLEGDIVNAPQKINAPDYSQIGEAVTSVIRVNKENSNFSDIVAALPTALNMPLNLTTNPDGENKNFVLIDSRIDVNLTAELPLDLRVLGLQNSITLDFSSGETDFIEDAKLRIKTENGFPVQGKVNVIFKNEQGDLLSITPNDNFDNPLFEAAPVDNNGIVVSPAITVVDISLNRNQLDLIEKATEAEVEIQLNTTDADIGQNVKLLSNYAVKVNLGIESSLAVNTNE